jgi:hypothetical protein
VKMLKSEQWRSLRNKFELLSDQPKGKPEGHWLRAFIEYKRDIFSIEERDALNQGSWCVLDRPEYWVCLLSEGPSESFRAQFDTFATRAGGGLDRRTLAGMRLVDLWLVGVFLHFRRKNTDQFSCVDGAGALIPNICEASAIFCSFLERQALERERYAARRADGSADKRPKRQPISSRSLPSRGNSRSDSDRPPRWSDEHRKNLRNPEWLKTQPSLSHKEAAHSLACSPRYIRMLVQRRKLNQTTKKRIQINNRFWSCFHLTHGRSK